MTPARLETFILAYGEGLVKAINKRPHRYALKAGDTPESYALRVACQVAELISSKGVGSVDLTADGFKNTCAALGIEHSEAAIGKYLEGAG